MLVTRKINVLSFFFGKPQAAIKVNARSKSKAQNLDDTNIADLENRISITKSQDLYKAQAFNVISPLSLLNR